MLPALQGLVEALGWGWCLSWFPGGDKRKAGTVRSSQGHTEVVAASPLALRPRHCQPRGHEAAEASKPKAIRKTPGEEAGASGGRQGTAGSGTAPASALLPFAPRAPSSRLKIMHRGGLKLLSTGKARGEWHRFPRQATVTAGERQSSDPAHTGPCSGRGIWPPGAASCKVMPR